VANFNRALFDKTDSLHFICLKNMFQQVCTVIAHTAQQFFDFLRSQW